MPYRYLEDIAIADVAFEASGKTLEELFAACADALLNVMVADLETVRMVDKVAFQLQNESVDMLLFDFLNELIFHKDARLLLLRVSSITLTASDDGFALSAEAGGERVDPERHPLTVDVKAVTLHRFSVAETPEGWRAQVVLDV